MHTLPKISHRGVHAPPSPVRKLVPHADKAKEKGKKVYHLNIGDPDFLLPDEIKKELEMLVKNLTQIPYSNARGEKKLITAWEEYYKQVGVSLTYDDIIVTTGGSEALILAAAAIFHPEDKFLVFEPFYANYSGFANLVSAKVVPVSLSEDNGFHLPSDEEIEKKIDMDTKAIFFTNPNNPTGTVFTKEEVRRVLDIANKHNLFIVADETYRGICFEGKKSVSVLELANEHEAQRIILTDSVSKRLNVCGARIGVLISKNKEVMDAVFRFAQARLSVGYLEQLMIAPMLSHCLPYVAELAEKYESRRNVFLDTIEKKLDIKIHRPEGAFYTMVPLPVDDTEEFAKWLLTDFSDNNETVMVAPGPGFYATAGKGKNEIRVAYVLNEKDLQRAAELIALGVEQYNKIKKKS
ncbi:MAG: pyridoxal phosphate-dependent aminotransferase [Candidatus Levyibacteriota bacterium]